MSFLSHHNLWFNVIMWSNKKNDFLRMNFALFGVISYRVFCEYSDALITEQPITETLDNHTFSPMNEWMNCLFLFSKTTIVMRTTRMIIIMHIIDINYHWMRVMGIKSMIKFFPFVPVFSVNLVCKKELNH